MSDLRLCLFYCYIVYSFFLPSIFIFLVLMYKNMSRFMIPIIIVDSILFVTLVLILYGFRAKKRRLWLYFIFVINITLITMRNLYLFISIIYRTVIEFDKKQMFFTDAIHRQVRSSFLIEHKCYSVSSMIIR